MKIVNASGLQSFPPMVVERIPAAPFGNVTHISSHPVFFAVAYVINRKLEHHIVTVMRRGAEFNLLRIEVGQQQIALIGDRSGS